MRCVVCCVTDVTDLNDNHLPEDRTTVREEGIAKIKRESEREREREHKGVLREDKHLWGSQLLNNSERDSQHSVQRRSTVRSAHSLQRRAGRERERKSG